MILLHYNHVGLTSMDEEGNVEFGNFFENAEL